MGQWVVRTVCVSLALLLIAQNSSGPTHEWHWLKHQADSAGGRFPRESSAGGGR